jgi:hypothetical protein
MIVPNTFNTLARAGNKSVRAEAGNYIASRYLVQTAASRCTFVNIVYMCIIFSLFPLHVPQATAVSFSLLAQSTNWRGFLSSSVG